MARLAIGLLLAASVARADPAKEIDDYLARCERFGFSGSVLVERDGKVLLARGYGLADRAKGVRATEHTVYEIASATKPFTACAILKLAEAGKLSLDDSIGKHLPGVREEKAGITVRHLLAHTSGIPRSAGGGMGMDLEIAVRGYLAGTSARPPGEAFDYWNGGYALLAGIVERVSGTSYMEFCREHLFKPAGLANTGFTGDLELERQAIGYDGAEPARPAAGHPYGEYGWQYRGMGGIVTSVTELRRFLAAYDEGKILSAESRRLMEEPVTRNYGLGWGMAETKRGTQRIGHGGDVRAFHTSLQRFPAERALVIVLTNVEQVPAWPIGWNVEAYLFGEAPPYPMPPALAAMAEAALEKLAGRYALDAENGIAVQRSGTGLLVTGEGPAACAALAGKGGADLSKEIEIAETVVRAVRAGDPAPVEAVLAEGIPKSWPGHLVGSIWARHVERWGALEDVRTLGAASSGRGYVRVLIELRHERGVPLLEVGLANGKLSFFRLDAQRFIGGTLYQPAPDGGFVAFRWIGEPPPRIRFEGDELVLPGDVRARKPR
jgi:CubicO group peptidase (beta-lactamase class C family)